MKLIFTCILSVLQIETIFGECGCQKDSYLTQLLINKGLNKEADSLTTANMPNAFGISPLNGQPITISNVLPNDVSLLDTNFNNLRAVQNTNRLSANDAFTIQENGVNDILRLKHKMGFLNGAQQESLIPNNYLLSPFVSSRNSNNIQSKDTWLNNIQMNTVAPIIDKPSIKNQYVTTAPFGNEQENVMITVSDLQNKINRNSLISEPVFIHSPGLSNDGGWNNYFMNINPGNTDIGVNAQHSNQPVSMVNGIPFKINNVADNNWFLGNDITTRNPQQSNCGFGTVPIKNNDISLLNVLLNNLVNCKSQLEQLPKLNKELEVDGNLLNTIISNNKSPINGRLTTNKDSCNMDLQNLLNNNILSNANVMPSQLAATNRNFLPFDNQIPNDNSIFLNNLRNQNYPILSSIDKTFIDIPQALPNSNYKLVDKEMENINDLFYNNLANQNYPIISNIHEPIIDIPAVLVNSDNMPIDKQMESINSMLFNNLVNKNYPIISNINKPSSCPELSKYMAQVISNLPTHDIDLPNCKKPLYSSNSNVLNLGVFGSLPVINGFPIASIVETVTVLNSNPNCI